MGASRPHSPLPSEPPEARSLTPDAELPLKPPKLGAPRSLLFAPNHSRRPSNADRRPGDKHPMEEAELFHVPGRNSRRPRPPKEFKVVALRDCPNPEHQLRCDSPAQAVVYWRRHIATMPNYDPDREWFIALLLTTRRHVKGHHVITTGILDQVLVHPREVFRTAIVSAAHAILVMHNHPGGDPSPSESDIRVTRELHRAGQLLRIEVLDHVIVTPFNHRSLKELGYFHP
jgi:proteasome lid subunit RPN8/RPN11